MKFTCRMKRVSRRPCLHSAHHGPVSPTTPALGTVDVRWTQTAALIPTHDCSLIASTLHGWADFQPLWMNLFWAHWSWWRRRNLIWTTKLSHTWWPAYRWCERSFRLEIYHTGFDSSAAQPVCVSLPVSWAVRSWWSRWLPLHGPVSL